MNEPRRGGGGEGTREILQAARVPVVSPAPKGTTIFVYHLGVELVCIHHGGRFKEQTLLPEELGGHWLQRNRA